MQPQASRWEPQRAALVCCATAKARTLPPHIRTSLVNVHTRRYVLAYIESQVGLRRGERVWQMGFGSGFKCNSAVWRARRGIRQAHAAWEGFDVERMRAHLASLPNHHQQPQQPQQLAAGHNKANGAAVVSAAGHKSEAAKASHAPRVVAGTIKAKLV